MAYNTELFGKVYNQIVNDPASHDQSDWVQDRADGCGTKRCVAGWALQFAVPDAETIDRAAAEVLSVEPRDASIQLAAGKALGLGRDEADDLFHYATNTQAVALVAFYAGYRPDKIDIYEED